MMRVNASFLAAHWLIQQAY